MYNNGRGQPLAPIGGGVGLETVRYNNALDEMNKQQNQFKLVQQQHQYVHYQQQQQFNNNKDSFSEYPPLGTVQQNNDDTADYSVNMPQYMYDSYEQPRQQQHHQQQQQQLNQQQQQRQQQQHYQQHHQQNYRETTHRPQHQQQHQQQQQQHRRDDNEQQQQYPQYGSYPSYRRNSSYSSGYPSHPPPTHYTQTGSALGPVRILPPQLAQTVQQATRQNSRDPRVRLLPPSAFSAPLATNVMQPNLRDPRTRPAPLLLQPASSTTVDTSRTVPVSNQRRAPPSFQPPWLLDDLVRHDQVNRHLGNWEKFPKSLDHRLNELVTSITPPLIDDQYKVELAAATQNCRDVISHAVVQHLLRQIDIVEDRLYECTSTAACILKVKKQAFDKIKLRNGGKLNKNSLEHLNKLTTMIGSEVSQINSLKPNRVKLSSNSLTVDALTTCNTKAVVVVSKDIVGSVAEGII
jgi:hypothetical protein